MNNYDYIITKIGKIVIIRKNDKDIDNHLKKAQKELLKWAKKL